MKYYQDRFKMRSPSDDTNENRFLSPCFSSDHMIRGSFQWKRFDVIKPMLMISCIAVIWQTETKQWFILRRYWLPDAMWCKSGKLKEFFLFFFLTCRTWSLLVLLFRFFFHYLSKLILRCTSQGIEQNLIYTKRLKYHQSNRLFGSSWTNVLMWTGANKWESRTSLNSSLKRCFHCSGCPN